jgi:hypothetical protein
VRFFEYTLIIKAPVHILWSCHIANLTLAIGLFLANLLMIRLASYLLILGVLPWLLDMVAIQRITPVSLLCHGRDLLGEACHQPASTAAALFFWRGGVIPVMRKPARPRFLTGLRNYLVAVPHGFDRAKQLLRVGRSVGIFPEGTTNRHPYFHENSSFSVDPNQQDCSLFQICSYISELRLIFRQPFDVAGVSSGSDRYLRQRHC